LELTNGVSILEPTAEEVAAMTVKIPLRLRGLDLRDADAYSSIDPDLAELSWEANGGLSIAVVYTDDLFPVAVATEWARRIAKLMPGVEVAEAHDELVSISDIAARVGVAAEAARLWAAGKRRAALQPFPAPRQVVGTGSGGKSMSLYAWREVVSWIRAVIGIDPDDGIHYLSDAQYADLNADLVATAAAAIWHPIEVQTVHITTGVRKVPSAILGAAGRLRNVSPGENATTRRHGKLHVALR
jgi:hypothetical protein